MKDQPTSANRRLRRCLALVKKEMALAERSRTLLSWRVIEEFGFFLAMPAEPGAQSLGGRRWATRRRWRIG
jgi:hypothetical protein